MSARLTVVLGLLLTAVLFSLGLPLARDVAEKDLQALYANRVEDANLFASEAAFATTSTDDRGLEARLRRYDSLYGLTVMVVDTHGMARLRSRLVVSPTLSHLARPSIRTLLQGHQLAVPDDVWPGTQPLVSGEPVFRNGNVIGAVVIMSPTAALRGRIARSWSVLAVLAVLALLALMVTARYLTRWIVHPVHELSQATARIAGGDLEARSSTRVGPPELRDLAESFNDMAQQVQRVIESQRQFVADASHQLRNPLSALLLRLESLAGAAEDPEYPSDSASMLSSAAVDALEEGRSLATTLDTMLQFARAEHGSGQAEIMDVADAVDMRLTAWVWVARARDVEIVRTGAESALGLHDPGAVIGAFDAVIDNALKFSDAGASVRVHIAVDRDVVSVTVVDEGPGVLKEELSQVTNRFWRSGRHSNLPGSGLGMAVASQLLDRHGGTLHLSHADTGGLQVALIVPHAGPSCGG